MSSGLRSSVQKPRNGEVNSSISGDQRREILGGRALADQHLHALGKLFAAFLETGGLVAVAHAAGKIGIQRSAGQQRRVAIDMRALERRQLVEALGVLVQHARHVHELGEPDHLRMIAVGHQVGGAEPGARRFERCRRHAGGELHAQIHRRAERTVEKIAQAGQAEHVADLVRIADRRGRAMGQHAAVELAGDDERAFAMYVAVDETRNRDAAAGVDFAHSAVAVAGAHDHLTADRDITRMEHTGRKIEDACVAHDQVRRHAAHRLIDPTFQDLSHAPSAFCRHPGRLHAAESGNRLQRILYLAIRARSHNSKSWHLLSET